MIPADMHRRRITYHHLLLGIIDIINQIIKEFIISRIFLKHLEEIEKILFIDYYYLQNL
jgi:hypothetical protein